MLETQSIPLHIAVIMDGNGRWAKNKGLPRVDGHKQGVKALEDFIAEADKIGVKYVTVFAFSSENWKRPKFEVDALMNLLRKYLKQEYKKISKNEIRYNFIGHLEHLPSDIQKQIEQIQSLTKDKHGLCLNIALSYGGREEITQASKRIAEDVQIGKLNIEEIDEHIFGKYLYSPDIPFPDLLIRTSGEVRISNFLLWQMAYTEMIFIDTLWPDFSTSDLLFAIKEFQMRERRFGEIKED